MKKGLTETLFGASFIMVALISMKVIENRDKTIIDLKAMHVNDSTINAVNYSNHVKDSITISQMPAVEYLDFLKRNKK
jgi:hypothetical protein